MEFKVDYFILVFFSFGCILLFGLISSPQKSIDYWGKSFIPMIVFSLVEGLRFGRGNDYLWYRDQYYSILNPLENQEIGFMKIYEMFYRLECPFPIVTIIFSFLWIFSIYFLSSKMKEIYPWGALIYLIFSLILFESAIRQFLSLSFVLLAYSFFFEKKWMSFLFLMIIACVIHTSSFIYGIFLVVISFYKKCINWKLISLLYVFFVFVWDFSKSDIIVNVVSLLDFGSAKYTSYVDSADKWFSSDAIQTELIRSLPTKFFAMVLDLFAIIQGYRIISVLKIKHPYLVLVYNLFAIGVLGFYSTFTLEIMRRIFMPMYFLIGFILAYSFVYGRFLCKNKLSFCIHNVSILLVVYLFFKKILLSHAGQLFVWDVI